MKKICYIFGAVKSDGIFIYDRNKAFVIAADAGVCTLKQYGIKPDLTVGDFDSLGDVPDGIGEIVRHPAEKDDTDTILAVKEGLKRGFDTFIIYGGLGGRLDHTLANIQSLGYIAEHFAQGYLLGDNAVVTVIKDGKISFDGAQKGVVSAFAVGGSAYGVFETGLKYSLKDAEISPFFPVGVSNEFTGNPSEISVLKGNLAVIWQENPKSFIERTVGGGNNEV